MLKRIKKQFVLLIKRQKQVFVDKNHADKLINSRYVLIEDRLGALFMIKFNSSSSYIPKPWHLHVTINHTYSYMYSYSLFDCEMEAQLVV